MNDTLKSTSQIQQIIFEISGIRVGAATLTGSMKTHIRFKISKRGNPDYAEFTKEHQKAILSSINAKCVYADNNTIDVPIRFINYQNLTSCPKVAIQATTFTPKDGVKETLFM